MTTAPSDVREALTAGLPWGAFEAIDVENDEYVFFRQDGAVIQPSVDGGRVVCTATEEQGVDELRQRLRTYLSNCREEIDVALAGDTVSFAQLLLE